MKEKRKQLNFEFDITTTTATNIVINVIYEEMDN